MVILVVPVVVPRVRALKDLMENCTVLIATKNSLANGLGNKRTYQCVCVSVWNGSLSSGTIYV